MNAYMLFHLDGAAMQQATIQPGGGPERFFEISFAGFVSPENLAAAAEAGFYKPVARITDTLDDGAALERVFMATQNLDTSWSEAPVRGVTPLVPRACSTSVGDIAVDPDGTAHICARAGWTPIGPAPAGLVQLGAPEMLATRPDDDGLEPEDDQDIEGSA